VTFGALPAQVGAAYYVRTNHVIVNVRHHSASSIALAALLAHEATHVLDVHAGQDVTSAEGCYQAELHAFEMQARVWQALAGPRGHIPPADDLEGHLNEVQRLSQADPSRFVTTLHRVYADECG
jgi:hypothetical protein